MYGLLVLLNNANTVLCGLFLVQRDKQSDNYALLIADLRFRYDFINRMRYIIFYY
ncbi:hypothetical protein SAMN04487870_0871 [Pseudoalteromonas sp. DSM 26666]|nr:hypothetical protein SAMN04487870_0871 [Pseudoalteromonas sp. DSM 26666]